MDLVYDYVEIMRGCVWVLCMWLEISHEISVLVAFIWSTWLLFWGLCRVSCMHCCLRYYQFCYPPTWFSVSWIDVELMLSATVIQVHSNWSGYETFPQEFNYTGSEECLLEYYCYGCSITTFARLHVWAHVHQSSVLQKCIDTFRGWFDMSSAISTSSCQADESAYVSFTTFKASSSCLALPCNIDADPGRTPTGVCIQDYHLPGNLEISEHFDLWWVLPPFHQTSTWVIVLSPLRTLWCIRALQNAFEYLIDIDCRFLYRRCVFKTTQHHSLRKDVVVCFESL